MTNLLRCWLVGLACGLCIAPLGAEPVKVLVQPDESDEYFKGEKLRKVVITVDPENLKQLNKDPRKYVRASYTDGTRSYADVGLHLKGAAGSFRGFDDKPALTLNFDKFTKNQLYRDMDKVHLNNSVQDGSYMHELICGELARQMGIPTPRTSHAVVELNGRKRGLYTVKEGFDKPFLRRYFKNVNGNLYDGGFLTDVDANLKNNATPETPKDDHADLKALVAACREGDQKKRWDALNKSLDMDRFLANMVFDALTAHWDGYSPNKNNYRIYHDPDANKLHFMVHGMDQMFSNAGWGIWPATNGMVSRAVWETEAGKKAYEAKLRDVVKTVFKIDWMHKRIDETLARLKPFVEQNMDKNLANEVENHAKDFKRKIKERVEFVERELAKKKS
jgi:spore coat protein CotH